MVRLAIVALLAGCASAPQVVVPTGDPIIKRVLMDSAFSSFFAEYRELLPTENVLCLYGRAMGDSARVEFIKPAQTVARTPVSAAYLPCKKHKETTLLGMWHNHNVPYADGCWFSLIDMSSFDKAKHLLIDLVSCEKGIIARSKNK